jgi:PAS domain S-box-containing protein
MVEKDTGRKKHKSLKTLFIRTNLMIAVIPLLILSISGILISVHYVRSGINEKSELLIRALSSEIDDFIHHSVETLQHLAGDIDTINNKHRFQYNIEQAVEQFESFTSIQVIGKNGRLAAVAPYNESLLGNDMSRQMYFFPPDAYRGHRISSPFLVPGTGEPVLTISFSNGTYLVTGFISLRKLSSLTGKVRTGKSLYAAIVDENGYAIAHPNREYVTERVNVKNNDFFKAARAGKKEMITYEYQGVKKYGTVRIHPQTGWTLLVTQPKRDALRPVRIIVFIFLSALAGAALFAILSAVYNRRKILPPFNRLVGAAREIARGNYRSPLPETTYSEIETVVKAFRKMGETIESRQKQIEESAEEYRTLVDHANSIIIRWDKNGRYTFFNDYAERFFGYSEKETIGKPIIGLNVPEKDSEGRDLKEMFKNIVADPEKYASNQNEVMNRKGERFWMQWSNKPIYDENGNVAEILSIGTDRTEYRRAEEKLAKSLEEKEMLLKEIHHRVKNNMQIISSLLNLQSGRMRHPVDVELVKESQNRVYSMSLIHEQLYESENLAEIDFQSYIEELVSFLAEIHLSSEDRVEIEVHARGISLGVDKAIPCGLIVNELVSNSLKYAFPGRPKEGIIQLSMSKENDYLLTVKDSGIGFHEQFDKTKNRGLGYQLIDALTEQINGEMHIENNSGLKVTVTFP